MLWGFYVGRSRLRPRLAYIGNLKVTDGPERQLACSLLPSRIALQGDLRNSPTGHSTSAWIQVFSSSVGRHILSRRLYNLSKPMPTRPALEKRVASRAKMVVPLKTFTANAPSAAVHTLNLSISGARLGAFRHPVNRGEILVVQRKHKRAKCRVVWVRDMGRGEIHVGIEFLSSEQDFWGIDLEGSISVVCAAAR